MDIYFNKVHITLFTLSGFSLFLVLGMGQSIDQ